MTGHLEDDELVRHYYGDGTPAREAEVDAHLAACPTCRTSWDELRATLKAIDLAESPEPDAGFEQRIWARIQATTRQDGRPDLPRPRPLMWLGMAAGLAAAIVAITFATRAWPDRSRGAEAVEATAGLDANGRERVLLTALDDHFQRSEMLLIELLNAPVTQEDTELGFERATADDLLDSGRLYVAAARQNGNVRLAEMLEDLESVLVEVARSPGEMDRRDFGMLRARIEDDDLLFKVRAVSQQIQERRRDLQ